MNLEYPFINVCQKNVRRARGRAASQNIPTGAWSHFSGSDLGFSYLDKAKAATEAKQLNDTEKVY